MHKEGLTVRELREGCGDLVLMGGRPCYFGYMSLEELEKNTNELYDNAILNIRNFGLTPLVGAYRNRISGDPMEMLNAALRFNAQPETITRLRCLAAANAIWGDPEKVKYAVTLYGLSNEEKQRVADLHRQSQRGTRQQSVDDIVMRLVG